jgi:hypothetical protein
MATREEINLLMSQYAKFDDMFMRAVATNNRAEAEDIKLQMNKLREKLASLGEVAGPTPTTNEQPS